MLYNKVKASTFEVNAWLIRSIPDLSPYQKQAIRDNEMVRFSPFHFYKNKKRTDNVLMRLTLIFWVIVWISLVLFLPINYIMYGYWGYNNINWFDRWSFKLNIK